MMSQLRFDITMLGDGEDLVVDDQVDDQVNDQVGDPDIITILYDGGYSRANKITGGVHKPAVKDATTQVLIPDNISECALASHNTLTRAANDTPTCMSNRMANAVVVAAGVSTVAEAKSVFGCATERCVLTKLQSKIGADQVAREISLYLKIRGPTNNTLLNNVHIDETMQQWAAHNPTFYPYNFHMLNYASFSYHNGIVHNTPDTLVTIPFDMLYKGQLGHKYLCAGCIINTDTYQGDGVHWMALFADARTTPWTAEFFNSSGNAPAPEWVNWMEKTKNIMLGLGAPDAKVVRASTIRHQKSRTECGLYSLFYVWARLHGIPASYFADNRIPDQLMFEFRQHLFDDPSRPAMRKFDWDEYVATTKLSWE